MTADEFNDKSRKIKNNSKWIRYTSTGVGAIFQFVGICKTVDLFGRKFDYGITNNGVTVTYKF
jgi:molybdopterin synthase catalytic subunit